MHKETCRKFKELARGYITHRDGPKIQTQACSAQASAASRTPTFTRPLAKQLGFLCDRAGIHAAFSHLAGHCRWCPCNLPLGNWNLFFGGWGSCWSSEVKKAWGLKWDVLTSKMTQFLPNSCYEYITINEKMQYHSAQGVSQGAVLLVATSFVYIMVGCPPVILTLHQFWLLH